MYGARRWRRRGQAVIAFEVRQSVGWTHAVAKVKIYLDLPVKIRFVIEAALINRTFLAKVVAAGW